MPMKALRFGSAIAVSLLLFNACSKESGVSVQPDAQLSADYTLVDFDELDAPQISDGMTADFQLENPEKHLDETPCDRPAEKPEGKCDGKGKPGPGDEKHDLGAVLHKMDLTATQKEAIQGFMHDHCLCIAEHLKKANAINREVITTFNQKRRELMDARMNNRITDEEFKTKMKALKEEMIQRMKDNSDKRVQMEVMRKCEEKFLHDIASVLDARQTEIFKTWLAKHK